MSRRPPLIFIFTVTMTGVLNNTLISPAIPDILDEFGVASERAGMLVSAGSVAGIVVAPLVGLLADRLGRRVVLVTCLTLFGGFGGLAALAPGFEFLLGARLMQGVGSAGLINLSVVLIADHWSGVERTRLIGRNASVLTMGLALMPLLSGTVTETLGWRAAFGVYTVALLVAAVAWLVLDGHRPAVTPSWRGQLSGVTEAVKSPALMVILVAGFLVFMMIFGLFLTVFPIHLAERFHLGAGARGILIAVPALGSSLMAFNLGRIRGRWSARKVMVFAGFGLAAAFGIFGMAGAIVLLAVGAVVYGSSEGLLIPTLQDQALEVAPEEHRGAVMAVWVSAARAGQTVGPLLTGLALGLWPTGTVFYWGIGAAFLVVAVAVVAPRRLAGVSSASG